MTVRVRRLVLGLISGSAMAIAPLALSTVVVPATANADQCTSAQRSGAEPKNGCDNRGDAKPQGVTCKDGQIVDEQNGKCVALLEGISKQLQALPPPPALAGGGGGGLGGIPSLGAIPSLGTVTPTLVLPSVGLDVVPDLSINPDLGLGGLAAAGAAGAVGSALPAIGAPSLPAPPAINPLNPLGLPPPPDLTPGIPLI